MAYMGYSQLNRGNWASVGDMCHTLSLDYADKSGWIGKLYVVWEEGYWLGGRWDES